jgi:hypothetical protein
VAGLKATPIQEDFIIRSIRKIKQTIKIATNNELYVCSDDLEAHKKKRKSFERSMIFFGVLAAAVVLLLIATILLSGRFDIFAIISAFIIGAFILIFSIVFKYAPNIQSGPPIAGPAPVPEELEKITTNPGKMRAKKKR